MTDRSGGAGGRGGPRRGLAIAALAIAALHLGLCAYAFPIAVVFGDTPYGMPDHQTHFHHCKVVLELYERSGRLWGYDPGLLAGYPVGLFFDVDNKANFLWVLGLTRLGVPLVAAYNLFSVASALLAPFSLALAARLLDLRPAAIVAAFGLGALLWHLDSTVHFLWTGGMISFATASHLAAVVVALMHRMLFGGRPWASFAGLGALLPLTLLVHVWSFVILVGPLCGLYALAWRRLGAAGHARVWAAAGLGLAGNLYWLGPALARLEWLSPSARVGQATPGYVVADLLEVLVSPVSTGFAEPRTLLRFAALALAAGVIAGWRRAGDGRWRVGALTLTWLFGLAYFGALAPLVAVTEPYRFVVPAALFAGIFAAPGAVWLFEQVRAGAWRGLPRGVQAGIGLLALAAAPQAARQAISAVPELARPLRGEVYVDYRGEVVPAAHRTRRQPPVDPEAVTLAEFLEGLPGEGRILVGFWPFGEYLRARGRRPVIGGFPDRRVIHEAANIFRLRADEPRYYGAEFAEYVERYAIEYVVISPPYFPAIEQRRDVLEIVRAVGPHRIFRVKRPRGYVAEGTGEVRAGLNEIAVQGARPGPDGRSLVLRFHFMETLRCAPNCRLLREPTPFDPVGLIRVIGEPELPAAFVISQVYE